MRSIARFMDARNTTEGKFVSILLSLLLVFSFLNVTMFTDLANADEEAALAQSEELQQQADEIGDKPEVQAEETKPEQKPAADSESEDANDGTGSESDDANDVTEETTTPAEPKPEEPAGEPGTEENVANGESSSMAFAGYTVVSGKETSDDDSDNEEAVKAAPKKTRESNASSENTQVQDAHFYLMRPGKDEEADDSEKYTEAWHYLGKGKVNAPLASQNEGKRFSTQYVSEYPASTNFPTITGVDGEEYKYSATPSEEPGTYSIEWTRCIVADGWNNGSQSHDSGTATYHVDGVAHINYFGEYVDVDFQLCEEESGVFESVEGWPKTMREGSSLTCPDVNAPEGKKFDGWFTDSACTIRATEEQLSKVPESSVTFYGKYVASTFSVTYEYENAPIGVNNVPPAASVAMGDSVEVASTPDSIDGYHFKGWETEDVKVGNNNSFVMPARDVKFTGIWEALPATIKFNANGGQGEPSGVVGVTGGSVKEDFPTDNPSREGYTFEGWNTKQDGTGNKVNDYPHVFPAGDTIYYAQWKRDTSEFQIAPYEEIYDGCSHTPSFTGGLVEGERLEYAVKKSSLTPSSSEDLVWVSDLNLIHVKDSAQQVVVRVVNGESTVWESQVGVSVTIKPRSVTMVLPNQQKSYDGGDSLTSGNTSFVVDPAKDSAGVLENEEISACLSSYGIESITYAKAGVHAGEPLLVLGTPNGKVEEDMVQLECAPNTQRTDYDISFKVGLGAITPSTEIEEALTVEFNSGDKLYDGSRMDINPASVSPFASGIDIKYGLKNPSGEVEKWVDDPSDLNLVDAGTYTVVAKVSSSNYEGEKQVCATFIIKKRMLRFVGESEQGLTYNGNEQAFTKFAVKGDGYAPGQYSDVKYSVSGTEAGEYTGSFSPASAVEVRVYQGTSKDVTHNYTVELVPGTMVIEKAKGNSVFGINFAGVQGTRLVYDGQGHSVVASAQQAGSTIEYTLTPEVETSWQTMPLSFENAGQYLVYARATHPNYQTTDPVAALLTIEKRPVMITGKSLPTKEYDGTETFETGYEVEATSEGRGLVKHAKIYGVRYELKGTNAGTHTGSFAKSLIVIRTATGGVLNDNYRVVLNPGSFEITKRPYTVTTGAVVRPYNGLPLTSSEVAVKNLVDGETVDVRTTGSITEVGTVDNTYELAWTGTAKEANYQFAGEELGKLEVVEADYGVEVRGYVGPYDGAEHGVTVSAPADAEVSFSTDNAYRDVTDGAVEVEYTISRPNYRTITGTALVQIVPRPVTITVDDASKFAGAADPTLTGSVEGLVAGDSLGVSYVRANTAETAGIYRDALTAQYVENPNYAVTVVPGTFIILPAAPVPGEPGAVTPDPTPTPTPTPTPVVPTPTVPTPTVPTPTPAAPVPTPAAATPTVVTPAPAAPPVAATPVNETEVIDDDATPQAQRLASALRWLKPRRSPMRATPSGPSTSLTAGFTG